MLKSSDFTIMNKIALENSSNKKKKIKNKSIL